MLVSMRSKILPRPANGYLNKLISQPTSLGYSVVKAQPFRAANASDRCILVIVSGESTRCT